jgi:hypothetical protein
MTIGKNNYETAKVTIKVYDRCKYEAEAQKIGETEYNIIRWGIFNLADFNEADREDIINNDLTDEYDEYLRIWESDDESSTFRNSHVDMFRI